MTDLAQSPPSGSDRYDPPGGLPAGGAILDDDLRVRPNLGAVAAPAGAD
ncbi:MAG: hypothetical protein ACYDCL_21615 [Myxococcales bacterium]